MSKIIGYIQFMSEGNIIQHIDPSMDAVCKEQNVLLCKQRNNRFVDSYVDSDGKRVIIVCGYLLKHTNNWNVHNARDVYDAYLNENMNYLYQYDGSYVICILDQHLNRLHIINDQYGSIPVYYGKSKRGFAFAQEGRILSNFLECNCDLSMDAVIQILNNGHLVGDTTIYKDIYKMVPAQHLEVAISEGKMQSRKYWKIQFSPDEKLNYEDTVKALYDAVNISQESLNALKPNAVSIALTGGYDSRLVLGTIPEEMKESCSAFSWGVCEDIKNSDPFIAKRLSQKENIPFQFISYKENDFVDNWETWLYYSELETDNLGLYAGGENLINNNLHNCELIMTGDHLIGLAGFPSSIQTAIESVTFEPFTGLHPQLEKIIDINKKDELREKYISTIHELLSSCNSTEPRDIQDYLFHYFHAPGWLWSKGYYKEPKFTVFRPLMFSPVRNILYKMPARFRGDKRVLVSVVKEKLKKYRGIPIGTADTSIDWQYHTRMNHELRSILKRYTANDKLADSCLRDYFDKRNLKCFIDAYFNKEVKPVSREIAYNSVLSNIRRMLAQNKYMAQFANLVVKSAGRYINSRRYKMSLGAEHRILFRIAFITKLEEMIKN